MSSHITAFDAFCGAGGSSTGIVAAGVEVSHAANHWQLAIETHNTNHPLTNHDCLDLRLAHPSMFPHTTIAWFSPECTNHSLAKGHKRKNLNQMDLWGTSHIDPAEERSRATMREVVEFTAYHNYQIVIVENVVDIRYWQHYDAWLSEMVNLGYEHKACYLNAMFFGVPQSRDRIYVVFWKKGNKAPDLDFRPFGYCIDHGVIGAQQSWKKEDHRGRYGKRRQYVYCCPTCGRIVEPFAPPASDVIDWSIPSQRIGDRTRELKPKTIKRILEGLRRFAPEPAVMDTMNPGDGHVRAATEPLATQTTRQTLGLVDPFMVSYMNQESPPRRIDEPLYCVPTLNAIGLVTPQLVSTNYFDDRTIPVDQPMGTLTTQLGKWALMIPPAFIAEMHGTSKARGVDKPMMGITGSGLHHALIQPFISEMYGKSIGREVAEPLSTITGGVAHHALVTPFVIETGGAPERQSTRVDEPFPTMLTRQSMSLITPPFLAVLKNSYSRDGQYTLPPLSLDEPLSTIVASASQHALITPFVMAYYGNAPTYAAVDEPMPTMTAVQRHALVEPEDMIDDCGFRMLEPEELKRGMSFPDSYVILGNKRDQVKQVGNAVACRVAQALVERCVDSLAS